MSLITDPDSDARQLTPLGLYSHAADVVSRMPQMKGTPQQFKAMMLKQGVKPDELKWSGYDQAMAGKPMVTKADLKTHFERNLPKIQETLHTEGEGNDDLDRRENGTTQYGQYTLPGGRNYRELLLHTAPPKNRLSLWRVYRADGYVDSSWATEEQAKIRAQQYPGGHVDSVPDTINTVGGYRSSHWPGTPNVLAHLRMSDRRDGKKKILHVEEMQSDWAQDARKKGFKDSSVMPTDEEIKWAVARLGGDAPSRPEDADRYRDIWHRSQQAENGVPIAPYVDSTQKWVDLGLKRVLHEAAKGGYDKVVFTPGEEQAKRYDLSKHIRDLTLHGTGDNLRLSATGHSGDRVLDMEHTTPADLHTHVGQEVAQKLLSQPEPTGPYGARRLENLDLRTGGEGMKAFYDKLVPQSLGKLARKHDPEAKVLLGGHDLGTISRPRLGSRYEAVRDLLSISQRTWAAMPLAEQNALVAHHSPKTHQAVAGHSLDITPKMRESILKGQPAYASGGVVDVVQLSQPKQCSLNEIETLRTIAPKDMTPEQLVRWHELREAKGASYRPDPLDKPQTEPDAKLQKAAGGSVDHHPSDAQKAAGNYAKEHISFQGIPIAIENKLGSVRSGRDASGKAWSCKLPADYGYIKRTIGADGDHVDAYIGPVRNSPLVVVVNQHSLDGKWDEHKVVLGYNSERDALDCYVKAFSDDKGVDRIGSVEVMSLDGFKKWLSSGRTKHPVQPGSIVDQALRTVAARKAA